MRFNFKFKVVFKGQFKDMALKYTFKKKRKGYLGKCQKTVHLKQENNLFGYFKVTCAHYL